LTKPHERGSRTSVGEEKNGEIERYKHFKRAMFGTDKIEEKIRKETDDIDFKTYAKYLLKEGSITEKRELLTNLKTWLKLKNKQIVIKEKTGD
jgi:hypothetical protein